MRDDMVSRPGVALELCSIYAMVVNLGIKVIGHASRIRGPQQPV
jgi:hypothetical protein